MNDNRGMLTDTIQCMAEDFLGRKITTAELRLYPYIDYCIKNGGSYSSKCINNEERDILAMLHNAGHMFVTSMRFTVSRDFYNYIQNILAESYVCVFLDETT